MDLSALQCAAAVRLFGRLKDGGQHPDHAHRIHDALVRSLHSLLYFGAQMSARKHIHWSGLPDVSSL